MTKTRLLYWLKALVTPISWGNLYPVDKELDAWLWERMEEGHWLEPHNPLAHEGVEYVSNVEAKIAGKPIWVSNAPYANGHLRPERFDMNDVSKRRTPLIPKAPTRIRLQELTKKARKEGRIPQARG